MQFQVVVRNMAGPPLSWADYRIGRWGQRHLAAIQFLIDSAAEYGAARADAMRADDMLRVTKALVMAKAGRDGFSAVSAQEREAYASDEYQRAGDDKFEAVKEAETLRARRDANAQVIEAWRSMNANQRAAERGYGSHR